MGLRRDKIMAIKITKDNSKDWIDFTVDKKYHCSAKVSDEPSGYGIYGSRVFKLEIYNSKNFDQDNLVYYYDRGPDIEKAPEKLIECIIDYFENRYKTPNQKYINSIYEGMNFKGGASIKCFNNEKIILQWQPNKSQIFGNIMEYCWADLEEVYGQEIKRKKENRTQK